jgi:hypothetical protein
MTAYRVAFESKDDAAALARLAQRLEGTRYAAWAAPHRGLPGAPAHDDFPVRRRRLLLYDGAEVRAFHNFFEHELYRSGPSTTFVWPNGPVSEGLVDPRYAPCYLMLLKRSVEINPVHMFLGGPPQIGRILVRMGWAEVGRLGLFLWPLRLADVAAEMPGLRRTAWRRRLAAAIAAVPVANLWSSAARLALSATTAARGVRGVLCREFGDWADDTWQRVAARYAGVTRRDGAALNRLFNPDERALELVRVTRRGRDIGWVLVTGDVLRPPDVDLGFGRLRVGAIVDAFAAPEDARGVLAAGLQRLASDGVALVFGHFSHAAWRAACRSLGAFVRSGPPLFVSAAGKALLDGGTLDGWHLTDGDNDGPYYARRWGGPG